jgi:hypothetical protein
VTTDRSSKHELPEAVKTLIEARTGDAVYVVALTTPWSTGTRIWSP